MCSEQNSSASCPLPLAGIFKPPDASRIRPRGVSLKFRPVGALEGHSLRRAVRGRARKNKTRVVLFYSNCAGTSRSSSSPTGDTSTTSTGGRVATGVSARCASNKSATASSLKSSSNWRSSSSNETRSGGDGGGGPRQPAMASRPLARADRVRRRVAGRRRGAGRRRHAFDLFHGRRRRVVVVLAARPQIADRGHGPRPEARRHFRALRQVLRGGGGGGGARPSNSTRPAGDPAPGVWGGRGGGAAAAAAAHEKQCAAAPRRPCRRRSPRRRPWTVSAGAAAGTARDQGPR